MPFLNIESTDVFQDFVLSTEWIAWASLLLVVKLYVALYPSEYSRLHSRDRIEAAQTAFLIVLATVCSSLVDVSWYIVSYPPGSQVQILIGPASHNTSSLLCPTTESYCCGRCGPRFREVHGRGSAATLQPSTTHLIHLPRDAHHHLIHAARDLFRGLRSGLCVSCLPDSYLCSTYRTNVCRLGGLDSTGEPRRHEDIGRDGANGGMGSSFPFHHHPRYATATQPARYPLRFWHLERSPLGCYHILSTSISLVTRHN